MVILFGIFIVLDFIALLAFLSVVVSEKKWADESGRKMFHDKSGNPNFDQKFILVVLAILGFALIAYFLS